MHAKKNKETYARLSPSGVVIIIIIWQHDASTHVTEEKKYRRGGFDREASLQSWYQRSDHVTEEKKSRRGGFVREASLQSWYQRSDRGCGCVESVVRPWLFFYKTTIPRWSSHTGMYEGQDATRVYFKNAVFPRIHCKNIVPLHVIIRRCSRRTITSIR